MPYRAVLGIVAILLCGLAGCIVERPPPPRRPVYVAPPPPPPRQGPPEVIYRP